MQHMSSDGKAVADWYESYAHVKRFLAMGYDPLNYRYQVEDAYDALKDLYAKLYDEPLLGYPFVDNDQPIYVSRASVGHHQGYLVAGGYSPEHDSFAAEGRTA